MEICWIPIARSQRLTSAYQVIYIAVIQDDVSTLNKLFEWSCLTHRNSQSFIQILSFHTQSKQDMVSYNMQRGNLKILINLDLIIIFYANKISDHGQVNYLDMYSLSVKYMFLIKGMYIKLIKCFIL